MGISGSYENDSANSRLIELLFHRCNDLGAITYIWDNKNKPLPLVGEKEAGIMLMSKNSKRWQLQ